LCSKIGVELVLGVELARANPAGVGALGEYGLLTVVGVLTVLNIKTNAQLQAFSKVYTLSHNCRFCRG
jgi:translation initiation factor 6 (eIF-6)